MPDARSALLECRKDLELAGWSAADGGVELSDRAAPLWERLNAHHLMHTRYFLGHYGSFTWEARRVAVLARAERVWITIVTAPDGVDAAFAFSSVNVDHGGEIQSLYVDSAHRRRGLGHLLAEHHLSWLREQGVSPLRLCVAAGNEGVIPFYERLGFRVRATMMEIP